MLPVSIILHPTDFSQHSECAFTAACALARDYHARLIVMHAVPAGTPELLSLTQLGVESPSDIRTRFESWLRGTQAQAPGVRVEHRLESGDAAKAILRVARENHA